MKKIAKYVSWILVVMIVVSSITDGSATNIGAFTADVEENIGTSAGEDVTAGDVTEGDVSGEMLIEEDTVIKDISSGKVLSIYAVNSGGMVSNEIEAMVYTGKAIKPKLQIYDGEKLLEEKKDYTISYKNNVNANDATDTKKAPTIVVTGKGNYTGKDTRTFVILPKALEADDVVVAEMLKPANGKVQNPVPVITYNGKKLANKKDFTVSYPATKEGAYNVPGTYDVCVEGKGNYSGELHLPFVITDAVLMSKVKVAAIKKQTYTGSEIKPDVVVTYKGNELVKGEDYSVTYENNIEIGKATAVITGMGDYIGKKEVVFQIVGISISKAVVKGIENRIYNGEEQTQNFTVFVGDAELTEDTDYTVTYNKNKNAGTAQVIITGKGQYSGTVKKSFNIQAYDLAKDTEGMISDMPEELRVSYEKGGCAPAVELYYGDEKLVEKKDYVVSYKNNKKCAESTEKNPPTIIVTGKGNFKGKLAATFTIRKRGIATFDVSVSDMKYNPNPGKYKSKPTVFDKNGKKLEVGKDYEIAYYKNMDGKILDKKYLPQVGESLIVWVEGKGNYMGFQTATYRITQESFNKAKIKINTQTYTGDAITLDEEDISVKIGNTELKYGVDYVVVEDSYTKNVNTGTASVTIKGAGNYGGTKTVKFKIEKKKFLWF